MDTILITGVNGFIGRHLAFDRLKRGLRVVGLDVQSEPSIPLSDYLPLTLPSKNLRSQIAKWQPQVCLHCAGPASVANSMEDPDRDFLGSAASTSNLLDGLRRQAPDCRLVYLSSAAVYGNPVTLPIDEETRVEPISPYGFHKAMCEALCVEYHRVFGLRTAEVRIFSAYGVGMLRQVIADLSRKLLSADDGKAIELHGTGNETRDFIQVSDIVGGIDAVLARGKFQGEVYNLASGDSSTIGRVVGVLRRRLSPLREVSFTGNSRTGDPLYWSAKIDKLRALGFAPKVGLEDGLNQYAEWIKNSI
jgi:UDP-glucose 4-epimerase